MPNPGVIKYAPASHTVAQVSTVDGGDVYGQGAGALIHELIGEQHGTSPTALLKPSALDTDGFPSGRVANQRIVFTANVKSVG